MGVLEFLDPVAEVAEVVRNQPLHYSQIQTAVATGSPLGPRRPTLGAAPDPTRASEFNEALLYSRYLSQGDFMADTLLLSRRAAAAAEATSDEEERARLEAEASRFEDLAFGETRYLSAADIQARAESLGVDTDTYLALIGREMPEPDEPIRAEVNVGGGRYSLDVPLTIAGEVPESYTEPVTRTPSGILYTHGDNNWSADQATIFYPLRQSLYEYYGELYGIDDILTESEFGRILENYGFEWRVRNNSLEWPRADELRDNPDFETAIARNMYGADQLPEWFVVTGENGEDLAAVYNVDVPEPVQTTPDMLYLSPRVVAGVQGGIPRGTFVNARPVVEAMGSYNFSRAQGIPDSWERIPLEAVNATLENSPFGLASGGGGGRGSGGGGRGGDIAYDREMLIESIRNHWRSILLEDCPDPAGLADQYIQEATAFWGQGGTLDLDTWVRNKIRASGRYRTLYARLPASMSEEEYLAQYLGTARQLGLNERWTMTQVEAGLQSGAAPQGFAERLTQTPQYAASNVGAFAQQYAQLVRSLGPGVLQ